MRTDIATDPAVISIAARLSADEDAVVGKLHRIWSWADLHTIDGNASGVTEIWIDRYLSSPGFAREMVRVGWLQVDEAGVVFPHFDRHNGKTGKQRALTAKRVAEHKQKSNAKGNGDSVTSALPREEKRREDIRSIRTTKIPFDEQTAKRVAEDLFNRAGTNKPDDIPWQVAALVVAGALPEGLAVDAAQGVRECGAQKPWAYFRKCLGEGCSKRGIDLRALLPRVALPKGFDPRPPAFERDAKALIPKIKGPHDT